MYHAMVSAPALVIHPDDLPLVLGSAGVAFVVAVLAAHWVGRRMVRGLNRAVHALQMAMWRRRYARWAAAQQQPAPNPELLATVGKLIAGAR